jgi:hypothetical protein
MPIKLYEISIKTGLMRYHLRVFFQLETMVPPTRRLAEAKQLIRDFLRLAFNMKQFEVVEDGFLFASLKNSDKYLIRF